MLNFSVDQQTSKPKLQQTVEETKCSLSKEELLQESKVQEKQMSAIVKLLESQQLLTGDSEDLRTQLNMYI